MPHMLLKLLERRAGLLDGPDSRGRVHGATVRKSLTRLDVQEELIDELPQRHPVPLSLLSLREGLLLFLLLPDLRKHVEIHDILHLSSRKRLAFIQPLEDILPDCLHIIKDLLDLLITAILLPLDGALGRIPHLRRNTERRHLLNINLWIARLHPDLHGAKLVGTLQSQRKDSCHTTEYLKLVTVPGTLQNVGKNVGNITPGKASTSPKNTVPKPPNRPALQR